MSNALLARMHRASAVWLILLLAGCGAEQRQVLGGAVAALGGLTLLGGVLAATGCTPDPKLPKVQSDYLQPCTTAPVEPNSQEGMAPAADESKSQGGMAVAGVGFGLVIGG